jgi:hypothetical protein
MLVTMKKIDNRRLGKVLNRFIGTLTDMKKYSEILFMFVFCVYFYVSAAAVSDVSLPLVTVLNSILPFVIPISAFLQLFTHIEDRKKFILGAVILTAFWAISAVNGYASLKFMGLIAAGSIGIDYRKAIQYACSVNLAVILMTFLYTFAIDPAKNMVFVSTVRIRSTAGLSYPTNAASLVLYLCLMLFAVGRRVSAGVTLITGLASLILSRFYFDANTSTICSLMFLVVIIYVLADEYFFQKFNLKWLDRIIYAVSFAALPILGGVIFALSMAYGNENALAIKINSILHNRIKYTFLGISTEGVTWLGKYVEMIGASTPGLARSADYNYLDNSVVQMVICFGILASICIVAMWLYILYRSVKGRNIRILLIAIIIAAHSFELPNFFKFAYNALLFLPLASGFEDEDPVPDPKKLPRKLAITAGACAAVLLSFFIIAPGVFSATRTVAYKKAHDTTGVSERIEADREAVELILENNKEPVYADVLTTDYCKAFKGISKSVFSGEDLVREMECTIITDLDYSYAYFSRGCLFCRISDYSAVYTTDRAVSESLINAGYHVAGYYYQENEIELNEKYFSGSVPVFDDKGTLNGTVKLLNDVEEGNVFYIQVDSTSGHAAKVYYNTDDFGDDKKLTYQVTFSKGWGNVSVGIYALNGAKLDVGTGIIEGNSIIEDQKVEFAYEGLYSDTYRVYSGKYKLHVEVSAADLDAETTESLGKIKILGNSDEKASKNLKFTELSEDGTYSFDFKFSSKGEDLYFLLSPDEACTLEKVSAYYVLGPTYDTHDFYNSKGKVIRREYYDLDGNKSYSSAGVFAYEYEYDKKGNVTATRYYDQDGSLMLSENGYAECRTTYDKMGYISSESYFGCDGEPIAVKKGYASYTQEVDVWGRPLVIRYFGVDGEPVITTLGYAEIHKEYDESGNIICVRYYDGNGDRITNEKGYSGRRFEYDENGNQTLIVYLDDNDKPVLTSDGYAQVHRQYDEKGHVIVEYFGDTNDQIIVRDGVATTTKEYDEFGNVIAIRYFGADSSAGYEEIRREYDSKNRLIYEGKFNSDGEAIILNDKYSSYRKTYDDAGNVIKLEYFGANGKPVMFKNKYAILERDYDENGKVIEERWYNRKGKLIKTK